jgi:hypothetical protein
MLVSQNLVLSVSVLGHWLTHIPLREKHIIIIIISSSSIINIIIIITIASLL